MAAKVFLAAFFLPSPAYGRNPALITLSEFFELRKKLPLIDREK